MPEIWHSLRNVVYWKIFQGLFYFELNIYRLLRMFSWIDSVSVDIMLLNKNVINYNYEIKFIFPKVKKNLNSSHYCFVTKREGVKKLNRKSLQFACNLSIYLTYFVIQKRDFLSLSGDSNGGWWVLGIKELKFN